MHPLPLHTNVTFLDSPDSCYYPDNGGFHVHEHITFSEWLPFKSANSAFSAPESHASPYTPPADGPATNPHIPLRSNASPGALHTHAKTGSSPNATWYFDIPSKSYPEQLADLNVNMYRAAAGLSSLPSLPLSSYLPSINEIFDASAALAELVENYTAERLITPTSADEHHVPTYAGIYSSAFDFNTTSPEALSIQCTMDTSIGPMIISCYQSLMRALEDICSLFLVWLSDLNQSANVVFIPPSETVTQVVNMTNLLSHLLQRLDQGMRAVDLGVVTAVPSPPQSPEYLQAPVPLLSDSIPGRIGYLLHGHEYHYSSGEEMDGASTPVFGLMEQTQERVKSQVRVIKRWIRKFAGMA